MPGEYWIETLGCPKNQVDSDKLAGTLAARGLSPAPSPDGADVIVVNTCAFIEAAREESIETVLELAGSRPPGSRLVVTGCMAERYGDELRSALPEVDLVAPFGHDLLGPPLADPEGSGGAPGSVPVTVLPTRRVPDFDLLALPRPAGARPWAYVKVAEGCDRHCGFCAIPSFRGRQRSRTVDEILAEVRALAASEVPLREVVLVAQDLASFGLDRSAPTPLAGRGTGPRSGAARPLVELMAHLSTEVDRLRLLYLYPSTLDDALVDAVLATGVPYFDLSLQHVSRPLVAAMRRWGEGDRFLERIAAIRSAEPRAAFRSSFIVGYPGETEDDHDLLLQWLAAAEVDWVGFFPYSREEGTHAADLPGQVPDSLVAERIAEASELQDAITARKRDATVGETVCVLVDAPGEARSFREAPEIDGVIAVPDDLQVGALVDVVVTASHGVDLEGEPVLADAGLAGVPA